MHKKGMSVGIVFIFLSVNIYSNDTIKAFQYHLKADSSWLNPDTCLKYTLLALPLLEKTKQWEKYQYNLNALSFCYYKLDQYSDMLRSNRFALEEAKNRFPLNHTLYLGALNNLGLAHRLWENYDQALELYFDALDKLTDNNNFLVLGTVHQNIGVVYLEKGDNILALNYFEKAIPYLIKYFENSLQKSGLKSYPRLAKVYQFKAEAFKNLNKFTEAINAYELAFSILDKNKEPLENYKIELLNELVSIYIKSKDYKKAINLINYIKNNFTLSNKQTTLLKINEGKTYYGLNEFETTIRTLKDVKNIIGKESISAFSNAQMYLSLAYFKLKRYDASNNHLNRSKKLLENRKNILVLDIYNWHKSLIKILIDENSQVVLDNKFMNTLQLQEYMNAAKNTISEIITENSQSNFLKDFKRTNELILEKLDKSISISDSLKVAWAFKIIENSKAVMLYSKINARAIKSSMLDDNNSYNTLIDIHKIINQFEKKLATKLAPQDSLAIKGLKDSIFTNTKMLNSKLIRFKKSFPDFYKKSFQANLDIEDFQEFLTNKDASFISYFRGEQSLFYLFVNKDSMLISKIENVELITDNINHALENIKFQTSNEVENFIKSSNYLYLKLFQALENISDEKIIISQDGDLFKLPFSILVSDTNFKNIRSIEYLLHKNTISYSYSAATTQTLNEQRKTAQLMTFIEPQFDGSNELLSAYSTYKSIFPRLKTKLFSNDKSKGVFIATLNNSDIIHLSTHSDNYSQQYQKPYFTFNDSLFITDDFKNLNLISELVSLNSCDSGTGKLSYSNGVESLSSSFTMGGAKTVVSTLWNINDQSSHDLFYSFYNKLAKAKHIDVSLNQAKLEYLKQSMDNRIAPYYWGGIISLGNQNPILIKTCLPSSLFYLFPFILILIFFISRVRF